MTAPYQAMTTQPTARMRSTVARARTMGQPQDPAQPTAPSPAPAVEYNRPAPVRARALPRQSAPAPQAQQAVPYTGGMVNTQGGDTPPPSEATPYGGGMVSAKAPPVTPASLPGSNGFRGQGGTNPYNANALRYQGLGEDEIAWANKAQGAQYVGKSGGKMRFRAADGTEFTNDDRNHAQKGIIDKMVAQDRELADPMSGLSLRSRFGTFMDRTGQIADTAYGDMGRIAGTWDQGDAGYSDAIDRMDSFDPTETRAFDPSFIRDMKPTAQQGWTPGALANFRSTATEGWSPTAMRGVDPSQLEGYDAGGTMRSYLSQNGGNPNVNATGATSSYDPRAAVEEYARGAALSAKGTLADALDAQENAAARSGRLNTGLFDKDKGTVIRRVGEDLNAGIMKSAVDAANIRAGIENTNTRNLTDASVASAREQGNLAGLRSSEARDAANLGYKARSDALGTRADLASKMDSLGLDAAGMIDKNRLTAADSTARLTLDQAQGIDDFTQKGAINYGDLALKRANGIDDSRLKARGQALDARGNQQQNRNTRLSLAQQLWGDAYGMYGDAMSGERDRVTGQENFDRTMRAQDKQSKRDMWGNIIGSVAKIGTAFAGGA